MKETVTDPRSARSSAAVAMIYTAVGLTVLEYWYMPYAVQARLTGLPGERPSMSAGITWAVASSFVYLVGPMLLLLLVQRDKPASIGFQVRGLLRHAHVYAGLYLLAVPALWLTSRRPDFLAIYPFVHEALSSQAAFLRWEAVYLFQFFALEAFFRGYLLFTLERAVGWLAPFIAAVPYCMIHWHKPPAEAFAAILGGVLLGALALRYRSFLGGVVVHALIALTMDLLAAHRAGLF